MSAFTGCCFSGLPPALLCLSGCTPRSAALTSCGVFPARVLAELLLAKAGLAEMTGAGLYTGNDLPDEDFEYPAGFGASPCRTAEGFIVSGLAGLTGAVFAFAPT